MASSKDKKINDLINYTHQVKPYRSKLLALVHRLHFKETMTLSFEEHFRETKSIFRMTDSFNVAFQDQADITSQDMLQIINESDSDLLGLQFNDGLVVDIQQDPVSVSYFTSALYPITVIEDSLLKPVQTSLNGSLFNRVTETITVGHPTVSGSLTVDINRISYDKPNELMITGTPLLSGSLVNSINRINENFADAMITQQPGNLVGSLETTLVRVRVDTFTNTGNPDIMVTTAPTITGSLT